MYLKKILKFLFKRDYGFVKNCVSVIFQIFLTLYSRIKQRRINTNWYKKNHSNFGDKIEINDIATSFWLRCILEQKYERVIEVGTRSGKRIRTLKKFCKDVEFYGVDIQENFNKDFSREEVKFTYNDLSFFKRNKKKTLIVSRGCLSYYTPSDLAKFLAKLYKEKLDLAFLEPTCFGEEKSIYRYAPDKSYYHPYESILKNIGFRINSSASCEKFTFMLSTMEKWYINIAFSK